MWMHGSRLLRLAVVMLGIATPAGAFHAVFSYRIATESNGFLVLSNPGDHFPTPVGTLTDVSIPRRPRASRY